MIKGVGTDIIEIKRVKDAIKKDFFLKRTFSEDELRAANNKADFLAGNFAVKEAFVKALGTGFRGIELKDLEVLRDDFGKPYIRFYNKSNIHLKDINEKNIYVSISNTKSVAIAMVVIEAEG